MLDPYGDRGGLDELARARASRSSPWNSCRASPARSRWTCCRSQANLAGYKAVIDAAGPIRPRLSDDDDGGRHGAAGQGVRHGRRRRGPAGDRHGPAARRHRLGDRCAQGDRGAGEEPRRQVHLRRCGGCCDRRRLCAGTVGGGQGEAGGARRRACEGPGHRHHHRAHPRPPGADPRHAGDGRDA